MSSQKGKRQAQACTQGVPGEDDGNQSVAPINQEHQRFPESIQKLGERPGGRPFSSVLAKRTILTDILNLDFKTPELEGNTFLFL